MPACCRSRRNPRTSPRWSSVPGRPSSAAGRGTPFRSTCRRTCPPVTADRRRVAQVLANLLANAARHSPESAPIRISAERDGGHVAVSVARQRPGHRAGASAVPVPQARRRRGHRRPRPRARRQQGPGRGPRRAHPGGQQRPRPGCRDHLHAAGRARRPATGTLRGGRAGGGARQAAPCAGGRRRPEHAAFCTRRALDGGIRAHRHGRGRRSRAPPPAREAAPRVARPDAARRRRHRTPAHAPRTRPTCR